MRTDQIFLQLFQLVRRYDGPSELKKNIQQLKDQQSNVISFIFNLSKSGRDAVDHLMKIKYEDYALSQELGDMFSR